MRFLVRMDVCVALAGLAGCRIGFDALDSTDAALDGMPQLIVCPAAYTNSLPSSSSRYRLRLTEASLRAQHQACAADDPGRTHLATLGSRVEANELAPQLDAVPMPNQNRFYVGAVQATAQTQVLDRWRGFDGEDVPLPVWGINEPDDLDGIEDGREGFAAVGNQRLMLDVSGGTAYAAVCECDGIPIPPDITALLPP